MHKNGGILNVLLTSASVSDKDRESVALLCSSVHGGLALADLGYRSAPLRQELKQEVGMGLLTPADVPEKHKRFLSQKREN
jgi:hypothetical protein